MQNFEEELFGKKKESKSKILILFVLIFLIYISYFIYNAYVDLNTPRTANTKTKILQNEFKIIDKVKAAGINLDEEEIRKGFWYKYVDKDGITHYAYFSLRELSRLNLSDYELQKILERIRKSQIKDKDLVSYIDEKDMPEPYQFHNKLYSSPLENEYIATKDVLLSKLRSGKYTANDLFNLAYLYELEGKYKKRDELYELLCRQFQQRCKNNEFNVILYGDVINIKSEPIEGAKITAISKTNNKYVTFSDKNGKYTLEVPARELEKIRLLAEKPGYSEGVSSAIVLTKGKKKYEMDPFVLTKNESPLFVDLESKQVLDKAAAKNAYFDTSGNLIIERENITFTIPSGAIKDKNKKTYKGKVYIFANYYTRENAPRSLLNVDLFDEVLGYAGNLMYSYGMPYIQVFDENYNKLYIYRSYPAKLRYTMQNLQELIDRGIVDKQDLEAMVIRSQIDNSYPINRKYIIDKGLWGFPSFWIFDQRRGVWDDVGKKLLDTNGLSEAIFYNINDLIE